MQLEVGNIVEGKITGITKFGAFVELPENRTGMVHISEVAPVYVKEISDHVKEGQMVRVKILSISDDGKISLSIKKAVENVPRERTAPQPVTRPGNFEWQPRSNNGDSGNFEDMMSKFKQSSDEKMSDLKKFMESKHGGFSRRGGSR